MKDVEPGLADTSNAERTIEGITTRLCQVDRAEDLLNRGHGKDLVVDVADDRARRRVVCSSARPPHEGWLAPVGLRRNLRAASAPNPLPRSNKEVGSGTGAGCSLRKVRPR